MSFLLYIFIDFFLSFSSLLSLFFLSFLFFSFLFFLHLCSFFDLSLSLIGRCQCKWRQCKQWQYRLKDCCRLHCFRLRNVIVNEGSVNEGSVNDGSPLLYTAVNYTALPLFTHGSGNDSIVILYNTLPLFTSFSTLPSFFCQSILIVYLYSLVVFYFFRYIVGCRGVVQLGGPDPWSR